MPYNLTQEEKDFLYRVIQSPGSKIMNCYDSSANPIWKRLESLDLIHAVGSFKWSPTPKLLAAIANVTDIVDELEKLNPPLKGKEHRFVVGGKYKFEKDSDHVLHCGSSVYPYAICVDTDPPVFVSESGDMIWRNLGESIKDLVIVQELVDNTKVLPFIRYIRELKDK